MFESGMHLGPSVTPSSVPMLAVPRYVLRRAGEDHPDVQGRLGCTRLVIAPQPPSAKNGTLQSDVDIPGERDRRYGPPLPKRSDDDGGGDVIRWRSGGRRALLWIQPLQQDTTTPDDVLRLTPPLARRSLTSAAAARRRGHRTVRRSSPSEASS